MSKATEIDDMHRRVADGMRQVADKDPIVLGALLAWLAQPLGEYMADFENAAALIESWETTLDEMFHEVPNDVRAFLKTYVGIGSFIVEGRIQGERISPAPHYTNAKVKPAWSGARPMEIPPWLWFRRRLN